MHSLWTIARGLAFGGLVSLGLISQLTQAQSPTQVLQLKISPLGEINAQSYGVDQLARPTDKYNMSLAPGVALRWLYDPFYIGVSSANGDDLALPGAHLSTFSLGFSGIRFGAFESNPNAYLLGGLGLGAGQFTYADSQLDDWEAMFEATAEFGLLLNKHWLLGAGGDYQAFGDLGDTKARGWRFYISSGWMF